MTVKRILPVRLLSCVVEMSRDGFEVRAEQNAQKRIPPLFLLWGEVLDFFDEG